MQSQDPDSHALYELLRDELEATIRWRSEYEHDHCPTLADYEARDGSLPGDLPRPFPGTAATTTSCDVCSQSTWAFGCPGCGAVTP